MQKLKYMRKCSASRQRSVHDTAFSADNGLEPPFSPHHLGQTDLRSLVRQYVASKSRRISALKADFGFHGGFCAVAAIIAGALVAAPGLTAERNGFDLSGSLIPANEIEHGGPPRDGIPSIDEPNFVQARRATLLSPASRVLGVSRNGVAKAYPIAILNWHEVVNDTFGHEAIAVTFCPLCGTGMAFMASVEGRRLQFGVSGLLYNSDVLLYDRQTQSLWSQIAASAVSGPMKGKALVAIPIAHTTWSDWSRRNPDTLVLSPPAGSSRDYTRDPYAGYASDERLYFSVRSRSARYHPKERVIGVRIDRQFKAYPFVELARSGASVNDTLGGRKVRVEFDAAHRTGRIIDDAGREIPSVIAFWFAWYAFHPDTEVFVAASPSNRTKP